MYIKFLYFRKINVQYLRMKKSIQYQSKLSENRKNGDL